MTTKSKTEYWIIANCRLEDDTVNEITNGKWRSEDIRRIIVQQYFIYRLIFAILQFMIWVLQNDLKPFVALLHNWSEMPLEYRHCAPWLVPNDLNLQTLIGSWFFIVDNTTTANWVTTFVWNLTNLNSSNLTIYVRKDNKRSSINLSIYVKMSEMTID